MKVLVTGSSGLVGSQLIQDLSTNGHLAVKFDLTDGNDILNIAKLDDLISGCDVVIHSAALLGEPNQSDSEIMATNLQGTWNVLCSAKRAGISRVIFLSSVDVLGVFKGERSPEYLPLDDSHPCNPGTSYGISKYLAENMCRLFANSTDVSIVSIRPPGVWTDETYEFISSERKKRPEFEWDPYWEFGAFIDVRDLSQACINALNCPIDRFESFLISSSDITTSGRDSKELAEMIHPDVQWKGGAIYDEAPFHTIVDISKAQRILGWQPMYTWEMFTKTN